MVSFPVSNHVKSFFSGKHVDHGGPSSIMIVLDNNLCKSVENVFYYCERRNVYIVHILPGADT